ncbi:MAG: LysM peptidoglycan-binding domain-containing protein [Gammaproteobacteria bacterium]|nr:MAG: LysM peptidoglycan-binding domain-containing protein [Gammaproteobacteria bacterium]
MSLIININRLCMLLLVSLVSASVTDRFIQLGNIQAGQISQERYKDIESAADLTTYRLYKSPDIIIPSVTTPGLYKPTGDSVSVADIWTRVRKGFVFPAVDPGVVRTYIDEYIKHPVLLKQALLRGEPYLFHILARLEQDDMPTELALLPVIESAFDPFASSPAGAAGIWQFMPETAAYVGLNLDWWYDGRRDIIASTEAALDYLEQLNKRFNNDWLLTLAAYNAGSARVRRAIRKNRDAGKPDDFWNLSLPAETRSYVPKLIALRAIIENPHDYNISLPTLLNTRYFSTVQIRGQIDFKVAAQLTGVPLAILQRLNPGYDRSVTPPDTTHTLLFPKSVVHIFREQFAKLPHDQRVKSIRHKIRRGDNLSTIAQHYGTTVSVLRKINRLKGSKIIAGDFLIVPVGEQVDSSAGITYAAQM